MIFEAALQEMASSGCDVFGPTSFQGYLAKNALPPTKTAPAISIDHLALLSSELKQAGVMVFRLGASEGGRNTAFALARYKDGWGDYFLDDRALFSSANSEIFIPAGSARDLFAFQLLPRLTESSFVNLALASGLLGAALGLDDQSRAIIPATGQSTFTFQLRPHKSIADIWTHNSGQVEIDALFVARRGGKEVLFLVEAKTTNELSTLAKHKLVYPALALAAHAPSYFDVVPVYLRIIREQGALHILVCECSLDRSTPVAVSTLEPSSTPRRLVLQGLFP